MNILASLVESNVIKHDGCINVYLKNSINIDYNNIDSLEVVRYTKTKYNEAEDKLEYELDEIYRFNELAVDNKLISVNVFKDDYVSIVYYNRDNHLITKDLSKFLVYYEQKEYKNEEEHKVTRFDITLGKPITTFNPDSIKRKVEGYIVFKENNADGTIFHNFYINDPEWIVFNDTSVIENIRYIPFIRKYHVYIPIKVSDNVYFEDINGDLVYFNIERK